MNKTTNIEEAINLVIQLLLESRYLPDTSDEKRECLLKAHETITLAIIEIEECKTLKKGVKKR